MPTQDDVLYGPSAFRLLRIPPQVLALCPPLPPISRNAGKPKLVNHPVTTQLLGLPIHTLVTERRARRRAASVRTHLFESRLPPESILPTPLGVETLSPLFTLLTLARHLNLIELAMAMYELCGNFTVFKPTHPIEEALLSAESSTAWKSLPSWRRVRDTAGAPSDLWMRPPLITLEELHAYANSCEGLRGISNFRRAAKLVTGVTSSPFEAQFSMLLSLPTRMGGKGISNFTNNTRIDLNRNAHSIYGYNSAYADLFFEGDEAHCPLDVECQGLAVHDDRLRAISDSDRATALASMGIETLFVTYQQIVDIDRFDIVVALISRKTGARQMKFDALSRSREHELRRKLMIDWSTLADERLRSRKRHQA